MGFVFNYIGGTSTFYRIKIKDLRENAQFRFLQDILINLKFIYPNSLGGLCASGAIPHLCYAGR